MPASSHTHSLLDFGHRLFNIAYLPSHDVSSRKANATISLSSVAVHGLFEAILSSGLLILCQTKREAKRLDADIRRSVTLLYGLNHNPTDPHSWKSSESF